MDAPSRISCPNLEGIRKNFKTTPSKVAWARPLIDLTAFEHEQTRLGQISTLLGVVTDVANDGDWFRRCPSPKDFCATTE